MGGLGIRASAAYLPVATDILLIALQKLGIGIALYCGASTGYGWPVVWHRWQQCCKCLQLRGLELVGGLVYEDPINHMDTVLPYWPWVKYWPTPLLILPSWLQVTTPDYSPHVTYKFVYSLIRNTARPLVISNALYPSSMHCWEAGYGILELSGF